MSKLLDQATVFLSHDYFQAEGAKEQELLVRHVEAQKRLIDRLEDDVEVLVQQHEHFMEQMKVKQV